MMTSRGLLLVATMIAALSSAACARRPVEVHSAPVVSLDLSRAEHRARAFLATRGSTDPREEVVYHWTGTIRTSRGDEPLLEFEGYNIARFVPIEGTHEVRMLSREVGLYRDPVTGSILDCWTNPITGEDVTVMHVANDPVNGTFGDVVPRRQGDTLVWSFEFSLAYPSPLPMAEFGPYSASDTYESTEAFVFTAPLDALADPTRTSVPTVMTWNREGQWLPWMRMGQRPGSLLYQATGHKLLGGWDELPEDLRTFVTERAPEFARSPSEDDGTPNATTWTVFRDRLLAGEYTPACSESPADPVR